MAKKTLVEMLEGVRDFVFIPKSSDRGTPEERAKRCREAKEELEEVIEILRAASLGGLDIYAPSHLTSPQVAKVLGVTTSAVQDRLRCGTLTAEVHHGVKMIHVSQVIRVLEARRASADLKKRKQEGRA